MEHILKTYTAIRTGSMAGRDDGYPYTEQLVIKTPEQLIATFGKHSDEKYYKLSEITDLSISQTVEFLKKKAKEKEDARIKEEKRNQLEKLKKELGES